MTEGDFLVALGPNAVITRMKRISDLMLQDGKRMYKQLGLDIEPNWFAVFKLLRKHGALSITEISEAIGLSHPSVISIVSKMITVGYLAESRHATDSRKRLLELTDHAVRRMPEFESVWDAGTAGFKRMMHDTDILHVLDVLEERISERGFRQRTLDELYKIRSVEIIEFADEWAADFAALNYEWIEKYFAVEQHDREILDDPRRFVIDPGGQIFVALNEGRAAGTVAMIPANDGVVELTKMAVSPSFHRLGIGAKLIERCIEFARDNGYAKIFLETHSTLAPAIALYKKFGFVQVPGDPNSLYDRADVRMERAISTK